jgi:hypothetical protein
MFGMLTFFLKLGDIQIAFGIISHCYVQQPSYLLSCTPPFFTFINSLVFFTPPSFKCLDASWVQGLLIVLKNL